MLGNEEEGDYIDDILHPKITAYHQCKKCGSQCKRQMKEYQVKHEKTLLSLVTVPHPEKVKYDKNNLQLTPPIGKGKHNVVKV